MAEELKGLIEKINEEAVVAAEAKASEIEKEARSRAEAMIVRARSEADRILAEAEDAASRLGENQKTELKQVARDIMISLRREINLMLDKIVVSHVHRTLNAEEMTRIINIIVKEQAAKHREGIIISLKKDDLEKLEKVLFSELKEEIKKGITLKPSGDIKGGFIISYDSGKSYYDFTDKAIAEYITLHLKPKLSEILTENKQ